MILTLLNDKIKTGFPISRDIFTGMSPNDCHRLPNIFFLFSSKFVFALATG
jgi:hypothetical protein